MLEYRLTEGSLQQRFQQSRAKIQMFGGGFGNGKTTSGVIKMLQLGKDYPGGNFLVARSTYPKLNDTVRKEFEKWTPKKWVQSFTKEPNQLVLTNGSTFNFRYIAQQGKNTESSTSNLLSATYDAILVDQIEDPEIAEKDFLDLMGRLRGNTRYQGDDPTMPMTGPRWFIPLCNPTRNWVFRKLVKPMHDLKAGIRNPDLMIDIATGGPMVELFEGSTYTNKDNLPEDFIQGLESLYKGQMRTRFLMGEWGSFEGLVYPQYDPSVHMLDEKVIFDYLDKLYNDGFVPQFLESYDHGIAKPACYLNSFTDFAGNVFVFDGIYEKEKSIEWLANEINSKRRNMSNLVGPLEDLPAILADPAIFKRVSGNSKTVGVSVSGLFSELGLDMQRANNDIVSGVAKVQSYMMIDPLHMHPIDMTRGSPRIFFSNSLNFIDNEIVDYYWRKDTAGEYEDTPMDRNDHAMDALKYLLSRRPRVAHFVPMTKELPPAFMRWHEMKPSGNSQDKRRYRHGR